MFERKPEFPVAYVPWDGVSPDDAVRIGAEWLSAQTGTAMILMASKGSYTNNPLLPHLTAGVLVEQPGSAWKSGWVGGAILAPWPNEKVLATISDDLAEKITAVCIIEWGNKDFVSAWLGAHDATNLITNENDGVSPLLSPVVIVAMQELSRAVNHNNALVQYYEKAYAVRTLQELVRSGYRYDVDNLCAWALANGFTQEEVKHLRDYGQRILDGRTFQLREDAGPRRGAVTRWEQETS
jgi:hypothetical protein